MTGFREEDHPRSTAGRFRDKTQSAAETTLSPLWCANNEPHEAHYAPNQYGDRNYCTGRPAPTPAPRAEAVLRRQAWAGVRQDNLLELSTVRFDITALLDTMHVDDISQDSAYNDHVYEAAFEAGLVEQHDGPFELDLDNETVDEYLEARRTAGRFAPIAGSVRRTAAVVDEELNALSRLRADLDRREYETAKAGIITTVLDQFPEATELKLDTDTNDSDERVLIPIKVEGPAGTLWTHNTPEPAEGWLDQLTRYTIIAGAAAGPNRTLREDPETGHLWYGITID